MDLALALVEADLGPQRALGVARERVLFLRRPGSQSQFSVPLWSAQPASDAMRDVVEAIHLDPGARHGIDDLASLAGLSPRHSTAAIHPGDRSATHTCTSNGSASRRRNGRSQNATTRNPETIARRYGFEHRRDICAGRSDGLVGIAPSEYRDRFRTAHAEPSRPGTKPQKRHDRAQPRLEGVTT